MTAVEIVLLLTMGCSFTAVPAVVLMLRDARRQERRAAAPAADPVALRGVARELERLSSAVADLAAAQEAAADERVRATA